MTESEMWAIFKECDGDPVMISQFVDWIMENDCSPDLKSLTDTLLWMRDNGKWPDIHTSLSGDVRRIWSGKDQRGVGCKSKINDELFKCMPEDTTLMDGLNSFEINWTVMYYPGFFYAIQALDHALRRLKNPKVGAKPEKALK